MDRGFPTDGVSGIDVDPGFPTRRDRTLVLHRSFLAHDDPKSMMLHAFLVGEEPSNINVGCSSPFFFNAPPSPRNGDVVVVFLAAADFAETLQGRPRFCASDRKEGNDRGEREKEVGPDKVPSLRSLSPLLPVPSTLPEERAKAAP
jgi:hypothetical protein